MDERLRQLLFDPTVGKLVTVVVGIVILGVLGRFLRRSISRHVADTVTRYRARKMVSFAVYLLGALLVLTVFSDRLSGLTVAFGVAGAGIAFALQEVIASVAGWIAVSFGNFYSTGDRVQLGGIKGDVIDIGVVRTTLMEIGDWVDADLYNGRIVRIANSQVFKQPVFNYSADFPFVWDEITLPVRYGSDWKLARQMLVAVADEVCRDYALNSAAAWREAVNKYRLEEAHVEPAVTMVANDNWLQFTLRYIVDYRRRRSVKDQLFTRILEQVDQSANRIRLASATFEVVNIPRLEVSFADGKGTVRPSYVP
jgi:small-conductance mechanosensitive channel